MLALGERDNCSSWRRNSWETKAGVTCLQAVYSSNNSCQSCYNPTLPLLCAAFSLYSSCMWESMSKKRRVLGKTGNIADHCGAIVADEFGMQWCAVELNPTQAGYSSMRPQSEQPAIRPDSLCQVRPPARPSPNTAGVGEMIKQRHPYRVIYVSMSTNAATTTPTTIPPKLTTPLPKCV